MRLLALDSSTQRRSAALLVDQQVSERIAAGAPQDVDLLLPLVRELLDAARCGVKELDAIAFGAGPGAFTGVRIACGVAQGLAFASNLPVVPVSSLLVLAASSARDKVIAALDARMDEIYHAAYERVAGQWQCVSAPCVCSASAAPLVAGEGWFGVGSGFKAYDAVLRERYAGALTGVDATAEPSAAQVARLAVPAYLRGEAVPAQLALPIYLRDKVALTSVEQAALRSGGQIAQNGRRTTPI